MFNLVILFDDGIWTEIDNGLTTDLQRTEIDRIQQKWDSKA